MARTRKHNMKTETRAKIETLIAASPVAQSVLCTGVLRKPSRKQALAYLGFSPETEDKAALEAAEKAMKETAAMLGALLPLAGKLATLTGLKLASVKDAEAWHKGQSAIATFMHAARKEAVERIVAQHKAGAPIHETALFTVNWRGEREALNKGLCVDFLRAIGCKGLSKLKSPEIYALTLSSFRSGVTAVPIEADEAPDEVPAGVVSMADALAVAKPENKGKGKADKKAA